MIKDKNMSPIIEELNWKTKEKNRDERYDNSKTFSVNAIFL